MGLNEVYTLAAAFITSCPSSNVALPVKAFPTFAAVQGLPTAPGISFEFKAPAASTSGPLFVTFLSGLSLTSVPATLANGKITTTIPATAMGQTYAVLTNSNVTTALADSQVIAGPAVLEVTPPSPTYDTSIL